MKKIATTDRQDLAAEAVQKKVHRTYPTNKGFAAAPGISIGKGTVYPVSYTDETGKITYVRYAFDKGHHISVYDDIYTLIANNPPPGQSETRIELLRVVGLIILSISIAISLIIVIFLHKNGQALTALIGLMGVSLGYLAGEKPSRHRGTSN